MQNEGFWACSWGFTCSKLFDAQPDLQLGPQQKSDHLYEFWKSRVQSHSLLTSVDACILFPSSLLPYMGCRLQGVILFSPLTELQGL